MATEYKVMCVNYLDERYLLTFEFGGCFSIMLYRLVSLSEGAHLLRIFRLLFWTGVDIKNIHNWKSPCWKIYTLTQVTFVLPVLYISVYISLYFCVRLCLSFSASLCYLFSYAYRNTLFFLPKTSKCISFRPPSPTIEDCFQSSAGRGASSCVTRGWSYLDEGG